MVDKSHLLTGCRIAIPETRQLNVFANLLLRRGASVRRCPLIAIHDSPDKESIRQWVTQFLETPPDLFILLTGEGLERLLSFIERHNIELDKFIVALKQCKIISRGPKPARVLRQIGLKPSLFADEPTSAGVIQSLDKMSLNKKRVAIQLYGDDPNLLLMNYLKGRQACIETVAPYIYANEIEQQQVVNLIFELVDGSLDAIAFTSKAQVKRLFGVAKKYDLVRELSESLNMMAVAAVGPIVVDELRTFYVKAAIVPSEKYFMKPLVSKIVSVLGSEKRRAAEIT